MAGPYIGTLPPGYVPGKNKPKKYYTYAKGGKGRKANEILKLAQGQVLRFKEGSGYYAAPRPKNSVKPPPPTGGPGGTGSTTGTTGMDMQNFTLDQFIEMLAKKQQAALAALLSDSERRASAHQSALGGFGNAISNFATEQWNAVNQGYQNAGAAQTAGAEGIGGQVGAGIEAAQANQAALGQSLGYTGTSDLPAADVAARQIASEGGAQTGALMGQVGKAWGGYGATRPDYLGFMTGDQQMQVERGQIEADRDLRTKFLELGMDNPKTALEMWTAIQENKRQNVSTSLAQQTLRQNIAMQKAKLKQQYAEMRADAKTAQQKAALDRWYKEQTLTLKQQELAIDQQNANSRTETAAAATTRANRPPSPGKGPAYSTGTYQQKVAAAMKSVPTLFNQSGAKGKNKNRVNYAFGVLWPQMAPYVSAANQARAKALLRKQIQNAARGFTPDKDSGGFGTFTD